ncbi:phosphotransferase enzyme family protein [Lyngbya aestuarii BL J]|uniref:Phosphotransferase enzyme family protein n=1 Tax=Lyngbya aestuarii BL J TaxID=1348334 RepID=U7QS35_9CYAN|nr:WD40 repeat domain-containing serine/threonine-protein kinase [Lyngbya aestuarii]ERT09890.1 phosphotransferase enzyme family protein [Lyngbya aestuarii BL J]
MTCCLNPHCPQPNNPDVNRYCQACGVELIPILRGHYRVIKLLGEGGFGRTYIAEDIDKLNEYCVVKQFTANVQGTGALNKATQLFEQEARQLQQLGKHPQIPTLYAYFEEGKQLFLVQEYIEGETLSQLVEKQGVWTESQVKQLLEDLLPVLKFVHEQKVIHRDIKPDNIIQRRGDECFVLIDFGVAKQLSTTVLQTTVGTRIGSDGYASIEQMQGGEAYPASDLFSLGVTCFYLLTQVPPYNLFLEEGYGWTRNWEQHLKQSVSQELKEVLTKLLQKDVQQRYQSVSDILTALRSHSTKSYQTPKSSPVYQNPKPTSVSKPSQTLASPVSWKNATCVGTLTGHSHWVDSLAFSPNGRILGSLSYCGNTIILWDITTQTQISTFPSNSSYVWQIVGLQDCQISAKNRNEHMVFKNLIKPRNYARSHEGNISATGNVSNTILLDYNRILPRWENLQTLSIIPAVNNIRTPRKFPIFLKGHSGRVYSVAFSPDGCTLASGSYDQTIKLWDMETHREIATLKGHSNTIDSVAFSPDAQMLASGSDDKTVKLWDVKTQTEITTLKGHSDQVKYVAFSPDGNTLASGSYDKTIKLWRPR